MKYFTVFLITSLLALIFVSSACQSTVEPEAPVDLVDESSLPDQPDQAPQAEKPNQIDQKEEDTEPVQDIQTEKETQTDDDLAESDPALIEMGWQTSPHAVSFVQDSEGNNNTCARCHAPINWQPSMDDLPESCFACKFELEAPPSYIPEEQWEGIPCNICHEPDKKGNIQPEVKWLEIAVLEEYATVDSPTELCMKCHDTDNVPEHGMVDVGGVHEGIECTECHNAHDTVPTCGVVECHEDVIDPGAVIAGHDDDHQDVSCVACHDGTGLDVGPSEDRGDWITFIPWTYSMTTGETDNLVETGVVAFASHNLVLESSCSRCHFTDNPWSLSEILENP